MLDCEWLLMTGDAKLTEPMTETLRSSGAAGISDVCDANFGENTLLNELCYTMSEQIGTNSADAVLTMVIRLALTVIDLCFDT